MILNSNINLNKHDFNINCNCKKIKINLNKKIQNKSSINNIDLVHYLNERYYYFCR